jgi:lipoic acid synthetase
MLGLGETLDEVREAMADLRRSQVDVLTLGQYLQPTLRHLPVRDFIRPEIFTQLRDEALRLGFQQVASGPLVRSSYHAEEFAPDRSALSAGLIDALANPEFVRPSDAR